MPNTMTKRCQACRTEVIEGANTCYACGAWFDEGLRGYLGRPIAVFACRWLLVLCWLWWPMVTLLGQSNAGITGAVGCFLLPLSGVTMIAAGFAHCSRAFGACLANIVLPVCVPLALWQVAGDQEALLTASFVACLLGNGWLAARAWARPLSTRHPWQCSRCGYLLVGLDGTRCPECGTPFNPRLLQHARRFDPTGRRLPPKP